MAKLSFFIGKGGVGKTTTSSAYAVSTAVLRPSRSILLLSTDPAHSLSDIFDKKFSDRRSSVKVGLRARLFVSQVDAQGRFQEFLDEHRQAILDLVEQGTFFSRQEIAPLLDSTMPGMAEISALLSIHELLEANEYDEIVIDTAPMGHTLRLFEMPQHFLSFLKFLDLAGSRDALLAQRFGGTPKQGLSMSFVRQWQRMVAKVKTALASPNTELVLVTSAEKFSLQEAVRGSESLGQVDRELRFTRVVLNRVVAKPARCRRCLQQYAAAERARRFLAEHFPAAQLFMATDNGEPVIGVSALKNFGDAVFHGKRREAIVTTIKSASLDFVESQWPRLKTPLSFTLGKGGVGKTTVSAGLALRQRSTRTSKTVIVCSTDPAPSLDDIFQREIEDQPVSVLNDLGLQAMELDSVAEYRRWAEPLKRRLKSATTSQPGQVHVDFSFDYEIFSALLDIVPPGVDEVFAIFRIAELADSDYDNVVIDMAPTGHALELLRTPARVQQWTRLLLKSLAAHRQLALAQDMAVEVASVGQRVRELSKALRDQKQSQLFVVMLPETLPDRQTSRLIGSLRELGLHSGTLFVNRVLFAEDVAGCSRCGRARAWQTKTLSSLEREYADHEIFIVCEFEQEVTGAKVLKKFAQQLWQLA